LCVLDTIPTMFSLITGSLPLVPISEVFQALS
jgi:hypothetical protein